MPVPTSLTAASVFRSWSHEQHHVFFSVSPFASPPVGHAVITCRPLLRYLYIRPLAGESRQRRALARLVASLCRTLTHPHTSRRGSSPLDGVSATLKRPFLCADLLSASRVCLYIYIYVFFVFLLVIVSAAYWSVACAVRLSRVAVSLCSCACMRHCASVCPPTLPFSPLCHSGC